MWRRRTGGARRSPEAAAAEPAPPVQPAEPPALTIDALGRKCPIPIIMLAERINQVATGGVVAVLADDPAAFTDVPAWCRLKSHEHVGSYELPQGGWSIHVRRNY
ncbi:sulfurtransferase TusA family protein [Microbispora hainanensis]|jgi:tRNA 2-thiouridine synthesizing protein A|uniref:Sulfurtransferase TusA family protein n=1 Tax=Microbispora hainanensis TaxID=568844 RepID=A0ABZ1STR4_9ACTN|nr:MULTISPECIES: sulfurtransferase TusA family protein [Microbispora]NJP22744.1 sulfurtransferase TusA family protein [Microbispora sp. CL1-1]